MSKREKFDGIKMNALKAAVIALIIPWKLPISAGLLPSGLMFIAAFKSLLNSSAQNTAGVLKMAFVMWTVPFLAFFVVFELFRKWNQRGA